VAALAQRALLGSPAQHRGHDAHVLALGVGGQVLDRGLGVLRQVSLGVRRHHDPLDAQRHTVHLGSPRESAQHGLDRGRRGEPVLLDRRQVGGVGDRPGHGRRVQVGAQSRLALEQGDRSHQGEQPRRLVPTRLRDMALSLQHGSGQGVVHAVHRAALSGTSEAAGKLRARGASTRVLSTAREATA